LSTSATPDQENEVYFFQHDISDADADAVAQAIKDGHISTGVKLAEFKQKLIDKFKFPRVELCSSGTSALHLALYALGIGPGDEVITTPYVGVWTTNPILMVGATPVFADIDRHTYNLSPAAVAAKVTERTKAVIPVSVNGNPIDLQGLRAVLPSHVRIICDDIEALGSVRQGQYVGQDIGKDISVGGFWVSKQVTTGCGGMVVSEDDAFMTEFEKLTRHGHGLVGDMWNQNFGFNAWLVDPLAALGIAQLERFEEKQNRLLSVESMLDEFFEEDRKQMIRAGDYATKFIYLIELPPWVDKKDYTERMQKLGVPTRPYFNSLLEVPHLQKYASFCPVTNELSRCTIALPFHWKLTQEEVQLIAQAHKQVLED
jgi:perosamine synthetase